MNNTDQIIETFTFASITYTAILDDTRTTYYVVRDEDGATVMTLARRGQLLPEGFTVIEKLGRLMRLRGPRI